MAGGRGGVVHRGLCAVGWKGSPEDAGFEGGPEELGFTPEGQGVLGKSVTASYPPRLDHSALVRTKTEAMGKEGWVESRSPRLPTNRSGCWPWRGPVLNWGSTAFWLGDLADAGVLSEPVSSSVK